MARNTRQTSTPSQETDIVLGIVSISESLQEKMVKDEEANEGISESLEQVITNISSITPYMVTAANMLVAITGYLFGDKGVNLSTNASSLLGKVKNTEPILGTVSPDKFYEQVQEEMDEAKADAVEIAAEQSCAAVEIKVLFENIDKKGLDALVNVLESIKHDYTEANLDSLENVIDAIDLLSELVEEINNAGLDKLKPKVQKDALNLAKTVNAIFEINTILKKNIVTSVIVGVFKQTLLKIPKIISELISGKNGRGGLIMVFNHYEKLKKHNPNVVIKQVIKLFEQLTDLFKSLAVISMLAIIAGIGGSKSITKALNKAKTIIDELQSFTLDLKGGKDIKDKIKFISEVVTDVGKLMLWVTIAGILSPLALIGATLMLLALKVIKKLIDKVIEITQNMKDAKNAEVSLKPIIKMIILIGVLMVIGALVGGLVLEHVAEILGFGAIFAIFSLMILGSMLLISKMFNEKTLETLKVLTKTVMTMAIIMIIGALFMMAGLHKEALKFGAILMVFTVMVMAPLLLFSKIGGKKFRSSMKDFCMLVITCTIVLIIGAFFMMSNLWKEALKFGAVLVGFLLMILIPLFFFSKIGGRKLNKFMKEFIWLIITCTLVLIIGALFMMVPEFPENALKFAAILVGFILAIILPIALLGRKLRQAARAMRMIVAIVIVGTLCLLLGALFIEEYGWENVLIFAGILAGFIGIIAGIMALLSLIPKAQLTTGMIAMGVIAGVILIGSFAMLVLGEAFQKFGRWEDALIMAGILCGVILAVGAMVVGLGFVIPFAALGLIAMLGIAAVVVVMCTVMIKLAICNEILNNITNNNPDKALKIIGTMAKMVAAIAGIAIACVPLGPLLLLGLPFLAAIAGVALMVSNCMVNIGVALLIMQKVGEGNTDVSKIKDMVMAFVDIAEALEAIDDAVSPRIIRRVARSMEAVGRMVSRIGTAVQDVSNLKVATDWDSDGNPISYKQLETQDFKNAADNTKEIVNTLGYAIIDIYEKAPDGMFNGTGLFGLGKSPFDKVVKSASGLGQMICKIGAGVQEIANLKVAESWDKDGNPISYRQLQYKDFKAAGDNVKEIVTTLGEKIITLYKENKDLFEPPPVEIKGPFGITLAKIPGSGDTPFEKVCKSVTGLGQMMSMIANGVKDVADLKVATAWNSEGKAISYRHLDKEDFQKAAENVKLVVTTLSEELIKIYKEDTTDLFKTPFEIVDGTVVMIGDCPAINVVRTASLMGQAMMNIASGLKEFADGKVKKYNKDGYETGAYTDIDWPSVAKKATETVKVVVTTLAYALRDVYVGNEKLFDKSVESITTMVSDGLITDEYKTEIVEHDSPLVKVIGVASGLGDLIVGCAKAIKSVESLKFNKNEWIPGGTHRKRATLLVTALCLSVIDGYNQISTGWKAAVGTDFTPDNTAAGVEQLNKLSTCYIDLSKKYSEAIKLVNHDLKSIDSEAFGKKWSSFTTAFTAPVDENVINKDKSSTIKDFFSSATSQNTKLNELVKTVNELDTKKADKFMELSAELRELSTSVANFDQLISALNGKINDTLNELSKKLELASNTIKESDKLASSRQQKVKENITELSKLMEKKMELELKLPEGTEMTSSSTSTTSPESTPSESSSSGSSDETSSRLAGVEQKLKTIHTNLQGVAGYGRK